MRERLKMPETGCGHMDRISLGSQLQVLFFANLTYLVFFPVVFVG